MQKSSTRIKMHYKSATHLIFGFINSLVNFTADMNHCFIGHLRIRIFPHKYGLGYNSLGHQKL